MSAGRLLTVSDTKLPRKFLMSLSIRILSVILGEGMSSRLFVELREKRGLVYDVHSGVAHFKDTGAFVVSAGVEPKRVYEVPPTILEQVADTRDYLPEEEMGEGEATGGRSDDAENGGYAVGVGVDGQSGATAGHDSGSGRVGGECQLDKPVGHTAGGVGASGD